MRKKEVIEHLCAIASEVGDKVYHNKLAHDCFCDPKYDPYFQFDREIIEFIRNAVDQYIKEKKS